MSVIHEVSTPCVKCEYDLFSLPPTQKHVENGYYTEYRSVSTLSHRSPLVFNIPASSDEYIDLEQTLFFIEVEITGQKGDGTALADGDQVKIAPTNNFLHSLFQQVDLTLNDKVVTISNNTYGYRAYFGNLLYTTAATKAGRLSSELWIDNAQKTSLENVSDNPRGVLILGGKKLSMIGRLHLDLSEQQKQLPPGINIQLMLTPNKPEFYLLTAPGITPHVKFCDASLFVRKTQLFHQPKLAHELALTKSTAKFPITRKEVRKSTIASGLHQVSLDNVVTGQLPRRMVVGFVDQDGFTGNYSKDPFNFEHKDLNFLAAYVDGRQIPARAYTPDFQNGNFVRAFYGLYQAMNQTGAETALNIKRDEYNLGFTLYGFNLSPDLSDGPIASGHYDLIKRGSLRIEAKFAKALEIPVNCIIYLEFDSLIEINKDRVITSDYN